jgi:uncharacterized OB-fold protein
VPDALDQAFWDACNNDQLVVQNCKACSRLQHPPQATCEQCGSADNLEWRPMSGRGTIHSYGVIYDNSVALLQEDQPFNVAVISLEEDPEVLMYSHLPGTPLDEVPIGAPVEVLFEPTPATGQKVPEWRITS